ncbi:MAG: 30S ribosomal protein S4 A [Parcubacteria group bacterium GW2011_GWA2_47_10b]|uniref:Small ribosomal subunit protein uS4 n=1 Tax=Candidatus Ryanbacteria bacterium RIFCSPLOWO2_02_FULL_47_14 TaxID=1802129 RepID=A0A1G2H1L2_9BACT|nr:MAG: 30S ribosomal protein S4 A [Parcubacteria group bacterium GW2011_GWA2_47_10b]KKU85505.1 MAG: 30S ribosomal protein S4 A [Parcubacteria group bacterium GW2011_GWA1_47_9]OGZ44660.1 MAG: 30S ribosomal protein S4 [Candidatus Ryanbacteria bacterium RIFCSPHIGHO2_01_FULL_48_80]OGZ48171.1 MAG: 30S ribosomal protein S4 [Candidatus Ryanbacteria bacterium RIFCSPHIGHO2_02_FULL_47_25]OGZ51793.1 MAG: 30S ribosomal protein S4 [Candidatus Ryanbacteria bacterium RIFCSPLOWO2_01_FULL_47_79]OGZ56121.1 MAG
MRVSCKTCRRFNISVCGREKCALRRKPYPPGIHGRDKRRRREGTEYSKQLHEKQVVRFSYGLSEGQFRGYVKRALAGHGGDVIKKLVESLEMRLDNIVYRLGFAPTRAMARQLVAHGHFSVDDKRVFVPSYKVRVGQKISICERSQAKGTFTNLDITLKKQQTPQWLSLDPAKREGMVGALPNIEDMVRLFNIKSIIEYYSR